MSYFYSQEQMLNYIRYIMRFLEKQIGPNSVPILVTILFEYDFLKKLIFEACSKLWHPYYIHSTLFPTF
jgi:hypothetical protein